MVHAEGAVDAEKDDGCQVLGRAGLKRRKLPFTTKTAKLGRFSQQSCYSDHLQPPTAHPGPPGRGDLESSVTSAEAEAPAYYQGVPPGRTFSLPKRATHIQSLATPRALPATPQNLATSRGFSAESKIQESLIPRDQLMPTEQPEDRASS